MLVVFMVDQRKSSTWYWAVDRIGLTFLRTSPLDYERPQEILDSERERVVTLFSRPKDGTHMAISLTGLELSTLDSRITPVDPKADWIVTDGGSAIRCDLEGMSEELEDVPVEHRSAQTLEVLRAFRADARAARSS